MLSILVLVHFQGNTLPKTLFGTSLKTHRFCLCELFRLKTVIAFSDNYHEGHE